MNNPKAESPLTDITVKLTGEDGNAFAIIGRVRAALRKNGRADLVEAFSRDSMFGDYDHLLQTCLRYVIVE